MLIVDDEVFRHAIAKGITLMEGSISVYTAEDGEQAFAIVKNFSADLVITDLRMPGIDGAELAL